MSLRLFNDSEVLSRRQKTLYKQTKAVFSYTKKVFEFTSGINNTEKAMNIIAHMVDNFVAFIKIGDFFKLSEVIMEENGQIKFGHFFKILTHTRLITTPLLNDFPVLPQGGYQYFFRNAFFIKNFATFQDLEIDAKHEFSEENFRGAIAYYCSEGERQNRLELTYPHGIAI